MMNDSSVVNFAQLVGTSEGEILVQSYDWTGFFSKMFRKIDGIKQYHHFSFEKEVLREGELIVRKSCSDVPSRIKFLKEAQFMFPDILPEVVQQEASQQKGSGTFMRRSGSFVQEHRKTKHAHCHQCLSLVQLVTRLCLGQTCLK